MSSNSTRSTKIGVSATRNSTGAPDRSYNCDRNSAYFSGVNSRLKRLRSSGINAAPLRGSRSNRFEWIPIAIQDTRFCPRLILDFAAFRGNLGVHPGGLAVLPVDPFPRNSLKISKKVTFVVVTLTLVGYSF